MTNFIKREQTDHSLEVGDHNKIKNNNKKNKGKSYALITTYNIKIKNNVDKTFLKSIDKHFLR